MGLKDKLKQRSLKSPRRFSEFEVYFKVEGTGEQELVHVPTITGRISCGYYMPEERDPYQSSLVRGAIAPPPSPPYLKVGDEFLQVPVFTEDAGNLPLCDRCAHQLTCLADGKGGMITPKDIFA